MKTINLFVKFHFTSLSLDAQPISVGIVSEGVDKLMDAHFLNTGEMTMKEYLNRCLNGDSKSFYAEFTDFNIDRCDDWVKENEVSRIAGYMAYQREVDNYDSTPFFENKGAHCFSPVEYSFTKAVGKTEQIINWLKTWLDQFKDFDIQFVVDSSYLSSAWIINLLDERIDWPRIYISDMFKKGLPKLPLNVCPVTSDLNELIAFNRKISVREAFGLDRKELSLNPVLYDRLVGDALFEARIIKTIYKNLR